MSHHSHPGSATGLSPSSDSKDAIASFGLPSLAALGLAFLVGCTVSATGPTAYEAGPPPSPPTAPDYAPAASDDANGTDVVINEDSDFYQPLEPYGVWFDVPGYGRCWRPRDVGSDWRPYCNGQWLATDDGWYWQSSESWGWATCHYGRWNRGSDGAWFWVPQTQWAPAWVEWRQGGGFCGWAPLPPSRGASVSVEIAPAAFVFVSEQHFSEPMRTKTVIINDTTIINRTTPIRNTQSANRATFNAGPSRATIEHAEGHQVRAVPARQVRANEDAKIKVRPRPTSRIATSPGQGPKPGAPTRTEVTSKPADNGRPVTTEEERVRSNQGANYALTQNSDAEAKAKEESEAKAKATEQAKAQAEAKSKADAQEEAGARAKAEAKERSLEKAKADERAEAEEKANTQAKAGAESREGVQGKASVQSQNDAAAKAKAAAAAKAKAEADAKAKAKAEAERRAQEEKGQSKSQQ